MKSFYYVTTLIVLIFMTCISCSKTEDCTDRCSRIITCEITAQMPELSKSDFSPDSKSEIEPILRIKWDKGDKMSVINLTTGKKLGGYIEAIESGSQVRFEGKQLVGSINIGDKLLFINDSESYSDAESAFSSSRVDISDQSGEMNSVPFCVYAQYTATTENSISVDGLKFAFLTNYVQLAVSGLPQNGTISKMSINDLSSSCLISIEDGKFAATPETGTITLSQPFKLNSKGNQMRYFSAFKSEIQAEARKSWVTYGDLIMQASWVKAALDKGCYYQSIVTGFQSANFIKFSDLSFKSFCVANADTNGDGEVSYSEAAEVEEFKAAKHCPNDVVNADELFYFTSLATCPSFTYCKALKQITLPTSLKTIPEQSFFYCKALSRIEIPQNVSEIGYRAFGECTSLSEIIIPNSVTTLEGTIFSNCTKLQTVVLPSSITEIPERMFTSCSSLSSFSIPEGITKIGEAAFSWCENLASVVLPESLEIIEEAAFNKCSFSQIHFPSSLKSIGTQSFANNNMLTAVVIPSTLEYVGPSAFSNCPNLKEITIESANTQFGEAVFSDAGISEVSIPEGTIELNSLFSFCKNLCKVNLPSSLRYIQHTTGPYSNGLFHHCESLIEINLPEGLQNIGYYSFSRTSIVEIDVPSTVKTIDNGAFSYCKYLTKVNLPKNLEAIGDSAFRDCINICEIQLPGAEIGGAAFSYCPGLQKVSIDEGTEYIGNSAFGSCTSLTDIALPSTLKTIGSSAFHNCAKLESVILPENLINIGQSSFECSGIKEMTIPDSVILIGDVTISGEVYGETFKDCINLKKITIGSGCSRIGGAAFRGCTSLEEIHMRGIYPPTINNLEISDNVKIYVPSGSKQYYENAENWSEYSSQIFEIH